LLERVSITVNKYDNLVTKNWSKALMTIVYLLNRVPRKIVTKTLNELWTK